MIRSFTIENFKSYKKAELKLAPLTVMVGANASGKSNALEAIRFLSWMAQGSKLSALQFEINQNNAAIRGQLKNILYLDAPDFTLGCSFRDESIRYGWNISLTLELRQQKELHIIREYLYSEKDETLYETVTPTDNLATDINVSYKKFGQGKRPITVCSDQLPIFTQMGVDGKMKPQYKEANRTIKKLANSSEDMLSKILFLDPSPPSMRDYSFISENTLAGNGKNLSAVLHNLIRQSPENKQKILNFIQSLPEQEITQIAFLLGPRFEVMVQLTETFGGVERLMDAGILSDGTLRVLAVAAALLSAPENSIVIIEEIDNGVHPSRAKQLLNQINAIAIERKLTILISTHNPALMDALPDEVLPDVVFCYRDREDGSSKLVSLRDVPNYPEIISQGSLGDLVTQNALSSFVKNYRGPEVRKAAALEWLNSIKTGL